MAPLHRSEFGADMAIATINQDPLTVPLLIGEPQPQLEVMLGTAADLIAADRTDAQPGRGQRRRDDEPLQHDPETGGKRKDVPQPASSRVLPLSPSPEAIGAASGASSAGWKYSQTCRANAGPSPGAWARTSGLAS